jgi:hypothetical protein
LRLGDEDCAAIQLVLAVNAVELLVCVGEWQFVAKLRSNGEADVVARVDVLAAWISKAEESKAI